MNLTGGIDQNVLNFSVQNRLKVLAEKVQVFSTNSNHHEPAKEKVVSL